LKLFLGLTDRFQNGEQDRASQRVDRDRKPESTPQQFGFLFFLHFLFLFVLRRLRRRRLILGSKTIVFKEIFRPDSGQ
jgi:hypothetical protein